MGEKKSGRRKGIALLLMGMVLGAALITPAGAHVGGTVSHLWTQHIKPKVTSLVYTKAQSNARYLGNTVTVVASDTVANGGFATLTVDCPTGYTAVGGGVDPFGVLTMDVTSSNPLIQDTRTLLTGDGQQGKATGWMGAVTNTSGSTKSYKVSVICARDQ